MPMRNQPTVAELWCVLAAGALHSCERGLSNPSTVDGQVLQATKKADLMIVAFHERFEWYDGGSYTGWRSKERNSKK